MAGTGTAHLRPDADIVLRAEAVEMTFPAGRKSVVHAVSGVSIDIARGETLGIVGESGCGKSTTARALIQLPPPTAGSVRLDGIELTELNDEAMRRTRPRIQMIFQDPISSLNPRRNVLDSIREGLEIWGPSKEAGFNADRVEEIMLAVGLDPDTVGERRPHEFSGGQCQRISIARALVLDPDVLICDEPVSALDVSVQAQILNLLRSMKARYGLTMVFISHDLSVVRNVSDRVMVMYLGKVCEVGDGDAVFERPAHPYTRSLLAAVPDPDNPWSQEPQATDGELPSPINPPAGCRFHTRCPYATDLCRSTEPLIEQVSGDHFVACHHPVIA